MALFNWLGRKPAEPESPGTGEKNASEAGPSDSKARTAAHYRAERARLRELLHKLVRESMVKMGVLSSGFQFKVLATDNKGRQFLVMMELAPQLSAELDRFIEIENLIVQTAKARYDITVGAVYWRIRSPKKSESLATDGSLHATSATEPAVVPAPTRHARHDPIAPDEIHRLKEALAASNVPTSARSQVHSGAKTTPVEFPDLLAVRPGSRHLTGEETTEIAETQVLSDESDHFAPLGPTQYGDLR